MENPVSNFTASDAKISAIFEWGRTEMEKINTQAREETAKLDAQVRGAKKRLVQGLAAKLVDRIPNESIAAEIAIQLQGKVSQSKVYAWLDAKFKTATKPHENSKKIPQGESAPVEREEAIVILDGSSTSISSEPSKQGETDSELENPRLTRHSGPTDTDANDTVQDLTIRLKSTEDLLNQEREIKISLQEIVQNLKASLEAQAVETELAKPKSAVSTPQPQQMKMDKYFKDFSDLVTTAHTEHCPAGCSTWQKASTISLA